MQRIRTAISRPEKPWRQPVRVSTACQQHVDSVQLAIECSEAERLRQGVGPIQFALPQWAIGADCVRGEGAICVKESLHLIDESEPSGEAQIEIRPNLVESFAEFQIPWIAEGVVENLASLLVEVCPALTSSSIISDRIPSQRS